MASSDVRALTVNDENASDDDRLVTAARPDTSATMANTTFAGGAARNVIVTTTGTGDNAKTCTITGTDVFWRFYDGSNYVYEFRRGCSRG
jgi:hypothetical protein